MPSLDEIQDKIKKCEKEYHNSFKTNSCSAIMNSWYALQKAKKEYYKLSGTSEQKEDNVVTNEE